MCNAKYYIPSGGFTEYQYVTVGEVMYINGFKCKIIKMPSDTDMYHAGLPAYANTSDIYIGLGPNNVPKQMRVYDNRASYKDFDWGHEHKNSDGTLFPKGIVHVQRYPGAKGGDARYMTEEEHRLFDAVILKVAPHAKLYPDK